MKLKVDFLNEIAEIFGGKYTTSGTIKVMINKKVIFNFSHDLLYTYKFGSQLHEF